MRNGEFSERKEWKEYIAERESGGGLMVTKENGRKTCIGREKYGKKMEDKKIG